MKIKNVRNNLYDLSYNKFDLITGFKQIEVKINGFSYIIVVDPENYDIELYHVGLYDPEAIRFIKSIEIDFIDALIMDALELNHCIWWTMNDYFNCNCNIAVRVDWIY